jgi:perosamine synthetase
MNYPIYTPDISNYTTSVQKCIREGWFSSQGEFIEKARDVVQRVVGTPYAVLVNNGTSATHLLYKALKFKHPELRTLYVPNYVFVAVWNCALYEYSPECIRVLETDAVTMNMRVDEEYIQTLDTGAAVVIVHNVGNVINVPRLKRLRPDLVFVEDSCEAFLETYEGQTTGTASLCSAASFFANKLVTTGEGGVWYTNDKELYEFIYKSCHHGMTSERYVYDVLGYNYRMTNVQAALLFDQMTDISSILDKKRAIYKYYASLLGDRVVTSGLWMMVLRIPGMSYPEFATHMMVHGIDTRPMFYEIQKHSHLRDIVAPYQSIGHSEIAMIPSSPSLTQYDCAYIAAAIKQFRRPHQLTIVRATSDLLHAFISNPLPPTFRYFTTRTVDHCLEAHTLTVLGIENDKPVAYAHLDDRWVGVCVLPEAQGRGYGSLLLDLVVSSATTDLRLTVDVSNDHARAMYTRRGFVTLRETDTHYYMEKSK